MYFTQTQIKALHKKSLHQQSNSVQKPDKTPQFAIKVGYLTELIVQNSEKLNKSKQKQTNKKLNKINKN